MPAESKKHSQRIRVASRPSTGKATPAPAAESGGLALPRGGLKLLAYALSLLPFYGFVLGLIFAAQTHPESKKFGQTCLVLAVLGLLAMVFLWGAGAVWNGFNAAESGSMGGGYY
ncbi:MAG: hypothetical protein AB1439_06310 [candidate division FCPU426 bacterium]